MQANMPNAEPILTAAEMRAAEAVAIAGGVDEAKLMECAGSLAAVAIQRFCGPAPTLVLAGPGNNGGDAYIVAEQLAALGWPVRVAALGAPTTAVAAAAASKWHGPTTGFADAQPAEILVDGLFGTGQSRGLDAAVVARFGALADASPIVVALDLPSGIGADDGVYLSPVPACDLTVAFGALKPAHVLQPAASKMGRIVIADIGLGVIPGRTRRNARPPMLAIATDAHKYRRGHVAVLAGVMRGAALLAARGAQRGGAGYVTISGEGGFPPSSIVCRRFDQIDWRQVGAMVIGPGLGRDPAARSLAEAALATGVRTVIDADAFALWADEPQKLYGRGDVMTPHEGEFTRYFSGLTGSKLERARSAAALSGNIVVLKGADTVIAAPDGRAIVNDHASPRLATAGSGDVLAGMIAARMAAGEPAFEAAAAAVWLHGDAARRARDGMIAEDLLEQIR